ncbi:DUF4224 domain-containing protein [Caballeronia udeis]
MTAADLERVTGMKRFSNQVEWFRREFSVNVARCGDGSPIMTWATFEALNQKRAGLTSAPSKQERPPLRSSTLRSVK